MVRALLLLGWMLSGAVSRAADEIEPLDGDFLEYLANMEQERDDWTLLEDRPRRPSAASESEQATQQSQIRKPTQEAAKPAVEER